VSNNAESLAVNGGPKTREAGWPARRACAQAIAEGCKSLQSVLGDGTAKFLQSVGAVGAVTNGRIRDISGLMTIPFPVYCRGTVVHHCALRFTEIDCPVSVGGITVNPGDIIHASDEGVIRIPPASAQAPIDKAPLHEKSQRQMS